MLSKDVISTLQGYYLFQGVDTERLAMVTAKCEMVSLGKGDIIFYKGDSYHKGLYLLTDGEVSLRSEFEHDEIKLVAGDMLGLTTFLGKAKYTVTASCESDDCAFIFFPEVCIYKLMSDYPDFRERINRLIIERVSALSGGQTDSILYSTFKSVGSYMTSPVVTVDPESSLIEAARLMAEMRIGSVVVAGQDGILAGVLSSKHVIHRFFSNYEENINELAINRYMNDHPVSIPPEFPLVEALTEMQRTGEDYAIVVQRHKPVGIISSKDVMRILFRNASIYSQNIASAETVEELAVIHRDLYKTAEHMLNNSKTTYEILPVLSSMHINIQRHLYWLTAEHYRAETGIDINTIPHALIIMGSAGRKESMLDPDQDNGFIFPDSISDENRKTLMDFGKLFSDNLDTVGYEYCIGNIMVTNPEMSNTISEWKSVITDWVENPGEKGIRWSSVVFDLSLLVGDEKLMWELRDHILERVSKKPAFLLQMLQNDATLRIPLSVFGRFLVEKEGSHKGTINLKRAALSFIVDVTRALTLYKKLYDLNTVERLEHLRRTGVLADETVDQILSAYEIVTEILLNGQVEKAKAGNEIDKFVDPYSLSLYNQERLKNALGQVSKFLSTGLRYFSGSPF